MSGPGRRGREFACQALLEEVQSIDKSSRIAQQILSEIQSGTLRAGAIVGVGEDAAAKRKVSAPTLRKVVRKLIEEGHLEALARGGRVPLPRRIRRNRVALVRWCDARGRVSFEAERLARFRRELELQALRMDLSLETFGYAGEDRFFSPDGKTMDWKSITENKLGLAIALWDIREDTWILEKAASSNLSTSIWDERPHGGSMVRAPNLRYFDTSYSPEAGRRLARHAVESGRKKIAWISPFHGALWSNQRLEGVLDGVKDRGEIVCQAVETQITSHRELEVESSDFWFDAARMKSHVGAPLEAGVDEIVRRLGILLARRTMCQRLSGLFDQALRSDADAWILANDEVAHLAWDWLHRKGKEVPRDLALAGFDDVLQSQDRGLTSIHFDEESLATACLRHMTGPREGGNRVVVRIPPILIARKSMP